LKLYTPTDCRMLNGGVSDSEATDLRVPLVYQPTVNSAGFGANAHFYFLGNFAETGAEIVPPFPLVYPSDTR